jgi:hypothetical protein
MSRLWMEESDGERWLINPALVVANPKRKRGKKMAARRRHRRNRMPAGLARYWAKHRKNRVHRRRRRHVMANPRRRRRARRNYTSAGMVAMNPRRRRHHYRRNRVHHRRHRARRNPSLMGFTLPPTVDIVGVGAGLIVPPMLANYIFNNFVAGTSLGTSKWAYLGTEAVSVAVSGMVVRKFVNVRVGNMMLLGGAARFLIDVIQTLAPSLLPSVATPTGLSGQPFLGYYERMPQRRTLSGMGKYYRPNAPNQMMESKSMIQGTPSRLDPSYRF